MAIIRPEYPLEVKFPWKADYETYDEMVFHRNMDIYTGFSPEQFEIIKEYFRMYTTEMYSKLVNSGRLSLVFNRNHRKAKDISDSKALKIAQILSGADDWVYGGCEDLGTESGYCEFGHALRYAHHAVSPSTGEDFVLGIDCLEQVLSIPKESIRQMSKVAESILQQVKKVAYVYQNKLTNKYIEYNYADLVEMGKVMNNEMKEYFGARKTKIIITMYRLGVPLPDGVVIDIYNFRKNVYMVEMGDEAKIKLLGLLTNRTRELLEGEKAPKYGVPIVLHVRQYFKDIIKRASNEGLSENVAALLNGISDTYYDCLEFAEKYGVEGYKAVIATGNIYIKQSVRKEFDYFSGYGDDDEDTDEGNDTELASQDDIENAYPSEVVRELNPVINLDATLSAISLDVDFLQYMFVDEFKGRVFPRESYYSQSAYCGAAKAINAGNPLNNMAYVQSAGSMFDAYNVYKRSNRDRFLGTGDLSFAECNIAKNINGALLSGLVYTLKKNNTDDCKIQYLVDESGILFSEMYLAITGKEDNELKESVAAYCMIKQTRTANVRGIPGGELQSCAGIFGKSSKYITTEEAMSIMGMGSRIIKQVIGAGFDSGVNVINKLALEKYTIQEKGANYMEESEDYAGDIIDVAGISAYEDERDGFYDIRLRRTLNDSELNQKVRKCIQAVGLRYVLREKKGAGGKTFKICANEASIAGSMYPFTSAEQEIESCELKEVITKRKIWKYLTAGELREMSRANIQLNKIEEDVVSNSVKVANRPKDARKILVSHGYSDKEILAVYIGEDNNIIGWVIGRNPMEMLRSVTWASGGQGGKYYPETNVSEIIEIIVVSRRETVAKDEEIISKAARLEVGKDIKHKIKVDRQEGGYEYEVESLARDIFNYDSNVRCSAIVELQKMGVQLAVNTDEGEEEYYEY